jgi:hypothetical protein
MTRDSRQILGRLMALRAVLWRTQFELHLGNNAPRSEIEPRHAELTGWIRAAKIPFSPREDALMKQALGTWPRDAVSELVWRNESAAILLWAIDQVPSIPPYTIAVPATPVMGQLEQLPQLAAMGDPPPLRPESELEAARELAALWNWRARTEGMRLAGVQPPHGDSFDATIARATEAALAAKLVDAAAVFEGDLALGPGVRNAAAPVEALRKLACVAHERHWTLTWMADASTEWDTVNPST